MSQALDKIKQRHISELKFKTSPRVVNCIKAIFLLLGVKTRKTDKEMVKDFSQQSHFLDRMKSFNMQGMPATFDKVGRMVKDQNLKP